MNRRPAQESGGQNGEPHGQNALSQCDLLFHVPGTLAQSGAGSGVIVFSTMKKASWILLAILGVAITFFSLVSAVHAYRTDDDYRVGPLRVSEVAPGDPGDRPPRRPGSGSLAPG